MKKLLLFLLAITLFSCERIDPDFVYDVNKVSYAVDSIPISPIDGDTIEIPKEILLDSIDALKLQSIIIQMEAQNRIMEAQISESLEKSIRETLNNYTSEELLNSESQISIRDSIITEHEKRLRKQKVKNLVFKLK